MLRFEFDPPDNESRPCACCRGRLTRLTRFVYNDGSAHAVYYALFTESPAHNEVSVLISMGEWGGEAPPSGRCAFYLKLRTEGEEVRAKLCNAAESPWGEVKVFGRTLDRDEALSHAKLKDVLQLVERIFVEDAPIHEYLVRAR